VNPLTPLVITPLTTDTSPTQAAKLIADRGIEPKGKRVILAGDFNSTETLSSFDTGGALPPFNAKETNTEITQQLLNTWRFKDLWTREDNEDQEPERERLEHLTHWNHEHTRGVRIDRIYANFPIKEAGIRVSTVQMGKSQKAHLHLCYRAMVQQSPQRRQTPQ
jgi:hypothetical protein